MWSIGHISRWPRWGYSGDIAGQWGYLECPCFSPERLDGDLFSSINYPSLSSSSVGLYCTVTPFIARCCTRLKSTVPCYSVLYRAMVYCNMLQCTVPCHIALHHTVLHCTILYSIAPYHTPVYCTIEHRTALTFLRLIMSSELRPRPEGSQAPAKT